MKFGVVEEHVVAEVVYALAVTEQKAQRRDRYGNLIVAYRVHPGLIRVDIHDATCRGG